VVYNSKADMSSIESIL